MMGCSKSWFLWGPFSSRVRYMIVHMLPWNIWNKINGMYFVWIPCALSWNSWIHNHTRTHTYTVTYCDSDKGFMTFISPQINTSMLGLIISVYNIWYHIIHVEAHFPTAFKWVTGSWFHWLCNLMDFVALLVLSTHSTNMIVVSWLWNRIPAPEKKVAPKSKNHYEKIGLH